MWKILRLTGFLLGALGIGGWLGCSGDLLRYRTKMWKKCQGDLLAQKEKHDRLQEKHKASLEEARKERASQKRAQKALKKKIQGKDLKIGLLNDKIFANAQKIAQLNKQKEQMRKRSELFKKLALKLKEMIEAGNLKVEIRKGRMIVKMSNKVLFDPGRARLKKEAKEPLRQLATVLKEIPDRDFVVAGHTDNKRLRSGGKFKTNWELSTARAVSVVKFLQKEGVNGKRLSAAGYSQFDPLANNDSNEGRSLNRRIEIVVMPKISELPPIQDTGASTPSTTTKPTTPSTTKPTTPSTTKPTTPSTITKPTTPSTTSKPTPSTTPRPTRK